MDKSALTVSCSNCYIVSYRYLQGHNIQNAVDKFSLKNRLPFIAPESVKPMQKTFLENLAKYSWCPSTWVKTSMALADF